MSSSILPAPPLDFEAMLTMPDMKVAFPIIALLAVASAAPTMVEERDPATEVGIIPYPDFLSDGEYTGIDALDAAFGFNHNVEVTSNTTDIQARGLELDGCLAACRSASKLKRFCRLIPLAPIRAGCWAATTAMLTPWGKRLCKNWCHAIF